MRADWRDVLDILVDPEDHSPLVVSTAGDALVSETGRRYELVQGQPVLLPPRGVTMGGWAFPPIDVVDADRPKPTRRLRPLARRLKALFAPISSRDRAGEALRRELARATDAVKPRVLVVGGATVGQGAGWLVGDASWTTIAFDIYPTGGTSFVADAHRIPLADRSVDVVWVQAVLEHVYRPDVVVAEIRRVLKPAGLVYAETPFLQPVHEGAFDFTRFTVSGHTMLFGGFQPLMSGPIGGPGAMLNLAVRGLVAGLTRSDFFARVAYALTLPFRVVDRAVPVTTRRDFCIGAFVLARRAADDEPRTLDPLALYRSGAE
jgi:SAM-dependent methyltransferase